MKNRLTPILAASLLLVAVTACNNNAKKSETPADSTAVSTDKAAALLPAEASFKKTVDGKETDLYVLKNAKGMEAAITNYGGRLVALVVPDKDGNPVNVVDGFDSIDGFINSGESYYGATIGRYGNRIAKGKFTLDGKRYQLYTNNGANTLHGGKKGYQAVVWDARKLNDSTLELTYLSKDGEENFPGNLHVKVTYSLTDANGLKIDYEATTDKTTVVNLTNHAFFNLNGMGSGTILNHKLWIDADRFTPVDSGLIPTGKLAVVRGTPFDFTKGDSIGTRINEDNEQLKNGKGYDHNFVLNDYKPHTRRLAATVTGDKTGIVMNIFTEEPGLQFYSGNFMKGANNFGKGGKDDYRTALALETQHFPDSPNQPGFPSTVLKPGETYTTSTTYEFTDVNKANSAQ
ncbi:galactose-1-epimerase [Chitinophaga parva]|uniref:Aldose 1-epimerase n=1 Tax=Chitinophaga parva TaxID=2169414 RepID=A0A2T7BHB2_9BACT|nr:aldose epimerase family protein [Chitinophaga parva]PUZ25662.1 galactose-1-epimerase [Chitinophaga parva]